MVRWRDFQSRGQGSIPCEHPSARTGEEFRTSAEMALDNINYEICGTPIEVVWIDSQSDPERATR